MRLSLILLFFLSFGMNLQAVNSLTEKPADKTEARPLKQKADKNIFRVFRKKFNKRFARPAASTSPEYAPRARPVWALILGALSFPLIIIGVNLLFELGLAGFTFFGLAFICAFFAIYLSINVLSRLSSYEIPGLAATAAILSLVFALPITVLGVIAVLIEIPFIF